MRKLCNLLTICAAVLAAACKSAPLPAPLPPGQEPAQKTEPAGDAAFMIGASIAHADNTWFEMGCEQLGLVPINKADGSGINIVTDALKLNDGGIWSAGELERFDVLVIMHVHNLEVCNPGEIADDWRSYTVDRSMSYTQAFDYIIRRYIDDCRALEYDSVSKWYGVEGGKPVQILLCTYWHDARVLFNGSIRRLCDRWKGYAKLCEFDTNIGFTKDEPDPETGEQISVRYARNGLNDTEVIDGVVYGWHPTRGRDAEIQQRMARIFVDAMGQFDRLMLPQRDS